MSEYIYREVGEGYNTKSIEADIDEPSKEDLKFIDYSKEDKADVSFYGSYDKKFKEENDGDYNNKAVNYEMYGNIKEPSVPISAAGRFRIDSSESEKAETVEESDEEWSEEYNKIYGTGNDKWNNYQQLTGEVFEFLGSDFFLTLKIPPGISTVHPFMYMAQSFNSQITNESDKLRQVIEGLYWTVLYAIIRHEIMRDDSATDNFDCIDPVLLREMQNTEPRLDSTNRHGFLMTSFTFLTIQSFPIIIFLKSTLFKRNLEFTTFRTS